MAAAFETITLSEEEFIKREEQLLQDILDKLEKRISSKLQAVPFGYGERTAKETAEGVLKGNGLMTNSGDGDHGDADDADTKAINKFSVIKKKAAILFRAPCARLFNDKICGLDEALDLDKKKRKFECQSFMKKYPGLNTEGADYHVEQAEVMDSQTMMGELAEFIEKHAISAAMCIIVFFGHGSEDKGGLCFNAGSNKHLNDFLKEIDETIIEHKDPDTDLPKSTRIIFCQCQAHHYDYKPKSQNFEVIKFTHETRTFTVTIPRWNSREKQDITDANNLDANNYADKEADLEESKNPNKGPVKV